MFFKLVAAAFALAFTSYLGWVAYNILCWSLCK